MSIQLNLNPIDDLGPMSTQEAIQRGIQESTRHHLCGRELETLSLVEMREAVDELDATIASAKAQAKVDYAAAQKAYAQNKASFESACSTVRKALAPYEDLGREHPADLGLTSRVFIALDAVASAFTKRNDPGAPWGADTQSLMWARDAVRGRLKTLEAKDAARKAELRMHLQEMGVQL